MSLRPVLTAVKFRLENPQMTNEEIAKLLGPGVLCTGEGVFYRWNTGRKLGKREEDEHFLIMYNTKKSSIVYSFAEEVERWEIR